MEAVHDSTLEASGQQYCTPNADPSTKCFGSEESSSTIEPIAIDKSPTDINACIESGHSSIIFCKCKRNQYGTARRLYGCMKSFVLLRAMAFYDLRPGQDREPPVSANTDFADPTSVESLPALPKVAVPALDIPTGSALIVAQGDAGIVARSYLGLHLSKKSDAASVRAGDAGSLHVVPVRVGSSCCLLATDPKDGTKFAQRLVNSAVSSYKIGSVAALVAVQGEMAEEPVLCRISVGDLRGLDDRIAEVARLPPGDSFGGVAAAALAAPLLEEYDSGAVDGSAARGGAGTSGKSRHAFVVSRPDRAAADAVDQLATALQLALRSVGCEDLFPTDEKDLASRREHAVRQLRRSAGPTYGLLYL